MAIALPRTFKILILLPPCNSELTRLPTSQLARYSTMRYALDGSICGYCHQRVNLSEDSSAPSARYKQHSEIFCRSAVLLLVCKTPRTDSEMSDAAAPALFATRAYFAYFAISHALCLDVETKKHSWSRCKVLDAIYH
jgi:hypothetical protein